MRREKKRMLFRESVCVRERERHVWLSKMIKGKEGRQLKSTDNKSDGSVRVLIGNNSNELRAPCRGLTRLTEWMDWMGR